MHLSTGLAVSRESLYVMFGSHAVPNNLSHALDVRFEPQVFRSALYSLSPNIWGFSHILLLAMSTLSPLWSETITHMI